MSRYISLFVDFDQCHVRTNLKVRENSVFADVFSGDSCAIRKKSATFRVQDIILRHLEKTVLFYLKKSVRYLTPHKKLFYEELPTAPLQIYGCS